MKITKKLAFLLCVSGIAALLGVVDQGAVYLRAYDSIVTELEIQKISDQEFEGLFLQRPDVQAFVEKFPEHEVRHFRGYASKAIQYAYEDDAKSAFLLIAYNAEDSAFYQCMQNGTTTAFGSAPDLITKSEC